MKPRVCVILLIVALIAVQWSDAGLLRRSRRLRRIGPPRGGHSHRNARVLRMGRSRWPPFLAPPRGFSEGRTFRRHPPPPQQQRREEHFPRRPPPPHGQQLRLPLMAAGFEPMMASESTQTLNSWRPIPDQAASHTNRDPTYAYAPPSLDRVRFAGEQRPDSKDQHRKRKPGRPEKERPGKKPRPPMAAPEPMFGRPLRRPSIWKLLATKQRRRPYPRRPPGPYMRYPENGSEKDEAEIFPRLPNILYFQHQDVVPSARPPSRLNPVPNNQNNAQIRPLPTFPVAFMNQQQQQQLRLMQQQQIQELRPQRQQPLRAQQQLPQQQPSMKPGMITNVPLYSHENQSPSLFNPVTSPSVPVPSSPAAIPQKPDDILYRPQEYMNPIRAPLHRSPTVLQPVKASTPAPLLHATRNTAIKPVEPTESLLSVMNDPPKPLNGFSILSSVNSVLGRINSNELTDEESPLPPLREPQHRPSPLFTTTTTTTELPEHSDESEEATTIHVSTSVSHSTSFSIGKTSTEASTTTTTTTTTTPAPPSTTTTARYTRLPEMPTYKKRQPIYPKRFNPVRTTPSRASAEKKGTDPGSSEAIVVMSRSKVKSYKPQFLANYTQLLTFDKVEETAAELPSSQAPAVTVTPSLSRVAPKAQQNSRENRPLVAENVSSQDSEKSEESEAPALPSSKTESSHKSPMEDFDPMQLLHSWFQNT